MTYKVMVKINWNPDGKVLYDHCWMFVSTLRIADLLKKHAYDSVICCSMKENVCTYQMVEIAIWCNSIQASTLKRLF